MATPIGTLAVRRSIWINARPERVWQEFETFERFKCWFGTGHELVTYEPRESGWLEFNAGGLRFGGRVRVFDPPNELTFEDARVPHSGEYEPLLITYRLTPHLDGTYVEFFVHGFERLGAIGPERLQGLENGWEMLQLNHLRKAVEGS